MVEVTNDATINSMLAKLSLPPLPVKYCIECGSLMILHKSIKVDVVSYDSNTGKPKQEISAILKCPKHKYPWSEHKLEKFEFYDSTGQWI